MAYKLLVMSPLHNIGASTVATMMAQAFAIQGKTSMLTFMQPDVTIPHYLGIENVTDPTRSIMQVVRLLDSGALRNEDILDYAHPFYSNTHLLNVADKSLSTDDRLNLVTHVFEHSPTDVVVIDDSSDVHSKSISELVDMTDATFVVINMSDTAAYALKSWLTETKLKDNPNVFVIVNHYDEVIKDLRSFAKSIGMAAPRVAKVHHNPWIEKCTKIGKLDTVLPLAFDYDYRVANLRSDFVDITNCLKAVIKEKSVNKILMKGL